MNTIKPKTIQIYLPKGDPRGLRVAELTTRIVRLIEVPRKLLDEFFAIPEAQQVGLYFLVGEESEDEQAQLYIGQTSDLIARLKSHHRDKDFWTRAFVAVSLTNSLTQTHTLFLEWMAIDVAQKVGRYLLKNGNNGSKPFTPAPLTADCLELHETTGILLATLGQPVFEALTASAATTEGISNANEESELYYCKQGDIEAKGRYTAEGFVVLAQSQARVQIMPSAEDSSVAHARERLIADGVLKKEDEHRYLFAKDYLFKSPSRASSVILGRNANGWTNWKTASGQTLDARERS